MDIRDWKKQYGGYLAAVNSLKQDAALQTDAVKKKALQKNKSRLNCGLRKLSAYIPGKYDVSLPCLSALLELFGEYPFLCSGCEKELLRLFGKVSLHGDMNIRGKAAAVAGILDCEGVFRYVYREAGDKDACFFVSWLVALADEKAEIRTVKEHLSAVVQTSRNSYDKTPEREHLLDLLKS